MTHTPHRLELADVSIGYGDKIVLRELTFNIPHGARVAVVGPNGAGKSTLFKALVGLLPHRGHITIHGELLGAHKDCVAYVPQREEVDWRFPVTVHDVVLMGRYSHMGWFGRASQQDKDSVSRALAQMGISNLAAYSIGALSGGQQQRVFLARALAQEPHILLMDEPFTGVDAVTQEATLKLLDELRAREVTAIISTHDLNLAATRFDYVLLLNKRLISYGSAAAVLARVNLVKAFGNALLIMNDGIMLVDECCPPEEHNHTLTSEGEASYD